MSMMFEVDHSVVDANELLLRVRQNVLMIKDERKPEVEFSGDVIDMSLGQIRQIQENLDMMLTNIQTMDHTWNHEKAPLGFRVAWLMPAAVFVKKVIRKCLYWMIKPHIEQQNAFNGAVTRAVSDSLRAQQQLLDAMKKN